MKQNIEVDFNLSVTNGETTSFVTDGIYEKYDEFIMISFIEQTDILSKTSVYIYNDKVIIKRDGQIKMEMTYILGVETIVSLTTDFNYQLSMRNYTQRLIIKEDQIEVVYQTETDVEQNVVHKLCLKWSNVK